jgi:phage-related baseplate assembly protein
VIMTKLTIADIADEMLKAFDLDDALCGLAMEQLHNRVKAQETDPEMATEMLNQGFLAALRKSNEKELREFARMKFESFAVAGRMPN